MKVEETVEESMASCSSSDEAKIMGEFERKKKELEQLQGEEMRIQMMQLEELQMKYELIKKKQEKDRQSLLKQQKEQILKMRLQQEEVDSAEVIAMYGIFYVGKYQSSGIFRNNLSIV